MLSTADLTTLARARLKDAKALLAKGRYAAAAYLCGYAVEIALKTRIVKTLKWSGFPSENNEVAGLKNFWTHDLQLLVHLSGREDKMKAKFPTEWTVVTQWTPESRYHPPGTMTRAETEYMIECAGKVVGALL